VLAVAKASVVTETTEVTAGRREKSTTVAGPSLTIISLTVSGIYLKKYLKKEMA
jgi:hypothetical protein